jgi:hypothetical protein
LQLLLLVDYIFDWARDIYREDILRELRVLATGSNDAASVFHTDPDIFSTLPVDTSDQSGEPSGDAADCRAVVSAQEKFTTNDTSGGVIRHASFVESKYCCVFVTRDNVQTLLQSIQQPKLGSLCKQILSHMQRASLVELSALDAIERQWTGCARLSSHQLVDTKFYTVMSFTTYISSSWHLIRELFAVAIAEDAWSDVIVASGLKRDRGKTRTPVILHDLGEGALLNTIKQFQTGSPLQVLHTAISRRAVKIGDNFGGHPSLREDDGEFRRIVHFVYVSFKRGNLEPQEPFLRSSQRLDQQHLLKRDVEPHFADIAHSSKDGCVMLTATCYPEIDPGRSEFEFCAYLTSGAPSLPAMQELSSIVANAFETCDVYHTTRSHWSSVLSPLKKLHKSHRGVWNLRSTYGVYSRGFGFLRLLRALGSETPITQGSSRAPNEAGSQLYKRNFVPWSDPRLVYIDRKERMFVLYKLFSREMQFWNSVARERIAQGLSCCKYCAAMGEDDVCEACEDVLNDPNRYLWFKACVMGEKPFRVTSLKGPVLQQRLKRSQNHDLSLREYIWNGRYDGPTDDDGDWAWNLDFYDKLEEPFQDIPELFRQWREYSNFCRESRDWGFTARGRKRKRQQVFSDQSREELDNNNLGEEPSSDDLGDERDGSEEGLDDSEEGLDDSEEGLDDSEEGLDDSEEGLDDSEEGLDDSEEGLDDDDFGEEKARANSFLPTSEGCV